MTIEGIKRKYDVEQFVESVIPIPIKPIDGITLLVGSSGSGKSTILKAWGYNETYIEDTSNTIEVFKTPQDGERMLLAFGLRSIPTWFRPLRTLSCGERHRAECAIRVSRGEATLDEFTSTVDRHTAKSLAASVRKYHTDGLLVIASCHRDIIDWLQPDHIYDTDRRVWLPRGLVQRPSITLSIRGATTADWRMFKDHHYLNSNLHKSCRCYMAEWEGEPVAFVGVIHRCCAQIPLYYAESRIVVRPQFQGLGIGVAMSETIAEEFVNCGHRYFSKTAHPALGEHRNRSLKWRATSTNMKARLSYIDKQSRLPRVSKTHGKSADSLLRDATRVCYSHEFIGDIK